MKHWISLGAACLAFGLFGTETLAQSTMASLQVTVSGYQNKQGEVMIALFRPEDEFLEKPFKTANAPAAPDSTTLSIEGLRPGDYALAVYLDENNNRKLDENFMGIPTEPYGFSNGAKARFSAPSFEDAKIQVVEPQTTEEVVLKP